MQTCSARGTDTVVSCCRDQALLDKQEADRAEAYRQRKMRIDAMQRGYESSAGAAMRAREEAEAQSRPWPRRLSAISSMISPPAT